MQLDKAEAARVLEEIRSLESRSASLHGYSRLAPYLMTAGLLWLLADLTLRFSPLLRGWAWPTAGLLAIPLFLWIAILQSRRRQAVAGARLDDQFRRVLGALLLGAAFVLGTFAIFSPTGHQLHGFMGLVTGFAFSLIGLWVGSRLLTTGIAIGVLTIISHFFFGPGDNILFMGLIGGGGMMLGAWWLGRA